MCGQEVGALSDNALADFRARNIGFIFQGFSLVPVLSAYENVEYPLLLVGMPAAERRERTLGDAGSGGTRRAEPAAAERAERRPEAARRHRARAGQAARARARRRADRQSRYATGAAIIELMHRMQASPSTTFIFSTHDPQLMSHADEIFTIRDGELVDHTGGSIA